VLRARAITATAIGLALITVGRIHCRSAGTRAMLLCLAIACGAVIGETVPITITADEQATPQDLLLALGRVLQWTLVGGSVAVMVWLWRRSLDARAAAQAAELRRAQIEGQLAQTNLQLLRSRIEPHFLFNTLATVRRLHHTDPAQGARLLSHFLSYLRSTLSGTALQQGTLGQEIDLVDAYLGIVALRMSGRLVVHWHVPAELRRCELPPLTMATLVENAVKHGITPLPEGGAIEIAARTSGGVLEVTVTDTGVGFGSTGGGGSGIGLANVRARLATLYGAAGTLDLQGNPPSGVCARMRLPCRPSGSAR
jgi:LytS/YehU family sensor histidine kinase